MKWIGCFRWREQAVCTKDNKKWFLIVQRTIRIHCPLGFLYIFVVSNNAKALLLVSSCGRAQLCNCICLFVCLTLSWKCNCNEISVNREYRESVPREENSVHRMCILSQGPQLSWLCGINKSPSVRKFG